MFTFLSDAVIDPPRLLLVILVLLLLTYRGLRFARMFKKDGLHLAVSSTQEMANQGIREPFQRWAKRATWVLVFACSCGYLGYSMSYKYVGHVRVYHGCVWRWVLGFTAFGLLAGSFKQYRLYRKECRHPGAELQAVDEK
jgi:hypothetical protein